MNKKLLMGAVLVASLAVSPLSSSYVYANQLVYSSLDTLSTIKNFNVNQAFDPDLYYARKILSEEGQKAWDVALEVLLNYDNSDGKYPLKDGNRVVTINYKDLGISIDKEQAQYIQKYLVRQEPRMFHLKDWGATVSTDKNGLVETQTFYIGNGMSEGNDYQNTLTKIEVEVQKILANIKDDMTVYQSIQAVQKAFESSVRYNNTGSPSDLRGAFLSKQAICGGYSKGFEYLLLRMGIESIWVEGYAGGYHAWNYVNVNDKWYLMDTTWGGVNWYLRGEVANHQVNQTYHIMPTLEKEGIPYKWGQYPGVWINTLTNTFIVVGEAFNPLDYIQGLGDIYGTDLTDSIQILKNDVNTSVAGKYAVVYEVQNKDGNKAQATLNVQVVDGDKLLADDLHKISGNMLSKAVSLYYDGKEVPYDKGLFVGERGTMEYDISDTKIKYFEVNVGINKNVRDNTSYGHYGKVQFEVYADDVLIYQSKVLGWKDNYEHISIEIPENTSKIKLVNVPKGLGNNHGAWGNPVFFSDNSELNEAKANLEEVMAFANQITDISYVLESTHQQNRLNNFIYARNYAQSILVSGSTNADDYKQAAQMLVYSIGEVGQTYVAGGSPVKNTSEMDEAKANLEEVMAFANQITDISYVLESTHQQNRLNNFIYTRNYAQSVLVSGSTNADDYKQAAQMLVYSIGEVGQTYVAGGSPISLN